MDNTASTTRHTLIRKLLRKYGATKVMIGITVIAVLCSFIITTGFDYLLDHSISTNATVLSIAIPVLLAPIFEYRALHLLDELDKTQQRLTVLATTDDLTGAYNRRHFIELANAEIARIERYGGKLSLAILDFDNFKAVNDHYGHLAGDQALAQVSKICRTYLRETDIFARYGGDEFILLFPETDETQARECLQRILGCISGTAINGAEGIHLRVSIGLFTFNTATSTLDDLLYKADIALYRAKETGGNKVI